MEISQGDESIIFPNPGNYEIPDNCKVTGYVITEEKSVADDIAVYKTTTDESDHKKMKLQSNTNNNFKKNIYNSPMPERSLFNDNQDDDSEFPVKFKHENFNIAGEWSKIEEKCHISPTKTNLQDVTFKSMENHLSATNHILLCGIVPNLINFVLPLRAKYLIEFPPIVILHDKDPTEKQWNQIAFFSEIYFVKVNKIFFIILFFLNFIKGFCS